jgi:hypothetical protein
MLNEIIQFLAATHILYPQGQNKHLEHNIRNELLLYVRDVRSGDLGVGLETKI